jgi:plasmid maintenance system antidote protein VapI
MRQQLNKRLIKGAIVTRYGSQAAAAPELGIHERRLSRLLNGHERIRPEEARVLQEKLGVNLSEEIRR